MLYVMRHALSLLVLPVTVAVFVPVWIARRYDVGVRPASGAGDVVLMAAGVACAGIGLTLFATSLAHFFRRGRGTLAPWDPPRRLVISGPYRYVRNPMISGVLFTLAGTALVLRSTPHAAWAATFALINAIYIPLSEEPGLAHRFGEEYREYCRHVRRFVPRIHGWRG